LVRISGCGSADQRQITFRVEITYLADRGVGHHHTAGLEVEDRNKTMIFAPGRVVLIANAVVQGQLRADFEIVLDKAFVLPAIAVEPNRRKRARSRGRQAEEEV